MAIWVLTAAEASTTQGPGEVEIEKAGDCELLMNGDAPAGVMTVQLSGVAAAQVDAIASWSA